MSLASTARFSAGLLFLFLLVPPTLRGGDFASPAVRDAQALAAKIDQRIAERWAKEGIKPAALADDAEFLRRVYLDLAGRIPRTSEAREFLEDKAPDKRARLIEKLLAGPGYVSHFTHVWRGLMLPEANNLRFLDFNFSAWVGKQLREDVPYDQMVRELLTAPVVLNGGQRGFAQPQGATPLAFYQAGEFKPENLAASSARLFLGLKLECAQCHDHPFAKHTRKQFWELAAFFAGIRAQGQNGFYQATEDKGETHQIKMPGTEKLIQARFPDGGEPQWKPGVSGRAALAEWMTGASNPYFARAAANRTWAHFFGIGLVEPFDEMGNEDNPPSHPELLDELGREFAAHRFDPKFLIRAIVNSKTYQLSSVTADARPEDLRVFRRMSLKALSGEQLFDSLSQATGYREPTNQPNVRFAFNNLGTPRAEFLQKFAANGKRTEPQTSILQALTLMNGKFVGDATDGTNLERTEMLAAVADAPFFDNSQRIEALYLATLSRRPHAEELSRMLRYVESGGARKDPRAALSDVFWALLNSTEFIVNH
jgi:hypothetical protein